MAKIVDLLVFTSGYLLIGYGIFSRFTSRKLAIILTSVTYLFFLGVAVIRELKPKTKDMRPEEVPVYLALIPRKEQTELFYSLVPEERRISISSPYFTFEKEGKHVLVATLYRFLNLTQEDIASAYRESVTEGASEVIILTRARDRKTLTLTALLPIKFSFPDKYTVYRALKKHNALPPKPEKPKKVKIKLDKGYLLSTVFNTKRAKFYMLTALSLALLSFITPLKNYYLFSALVPFILSIVSYFYKGNTLLN